MNVDIIIGITPANELVFVMRRDCVIRILHNLKLLKFVLCFFALPEKNIADLINSLFWWILAKDSFVYQFVDNCEDQGNLKLFQNL